jgi:hypothetical protein
MSEFKPYVAVQEFVLNLDNGKTEVRVNRGDIVEFDGILTARCKNSVGQAKPISNIIREGEWLKPIKPENIPILQARLAGKPLAVETGPVKPRNVTGGRLLENSDPSSTLTPRKVLDQDLNELIGKYEIDTANAAKRIESSAPSPRVIRSDDDIVATVKNDKTAAENSSGVIMGNQEKSASVVVSEEERVVKETTKKAANTTTPAKKKVTVIRDTDDKVVKKTGNATKIKTLVEPKKVTVLQEDKVVKKTAYAKDTHTDVGSSTQVSVEMGKSVKVSPEDLQQDAVVVKKLQSINEVPSMDGIIMNNFIGPVQDMDVGEVTLSSGDADMEVGDVTLSSGGTHIADLSGGADEATIVSSGETSDGDGGDIDISDLIG